MAVGALDGLRVVELAERTSGPYCAKLLADLGAEVVKVESPFYGDPSRTEEPFLRDVPGSDRAGIFFYLNSNKLGITLDVSQPEGRSILLEILSDSDVFIENLGASVTERLGLDYASLAGTCPRLVMTSISPYGQTGPRRSWKGTELTLWNASGYGVLTPAGVREDDEPPLHPRCAQAAYLSGANAAGATMAALLNRSVSGTGQQVDISEQETMIAALSPQLADYFYESASVWTRDAPRLNIMQFIPCKNGYVSLLITQPDQWDRLVAWMGNPEWAQIGEYRGIQGMIQNWDLISFMFAETFADRTKEELFEGGQANRIPIAPVNSIHEIVASPHLQQRGFFVQIDHPEGGSMTVPGAPYRLAGTPWRLRRPAPRLGQHNQEIYADRLHLLPDEIVKLRAARLI
ncbi:MAG: CaiB/BaiF CoA transferase family protein [Dehalococcoidia bacterium]